MAGKTKGINILIDRLTNSIENAISGDSFKTEVLLLPKDAVKEIKRSDWVFDWRKEFADARKQVFKLVIKDNPRVIQGMVSVEDRSDHIFMHLIESAKFNKGARKVYIGVPGNLVAFVCKMSFERGYEGFVSFESKTRLIEHYKTSLGAFVIAGKIMAIDTQASLKLTEKYFPEF